MGNFRFSSHSQFWYSTFDVWFESFDWSEIYYRVNQHFSPGRDVYTVNNWILEKVLNSVYWPNEESDEAKGKENEKENIFIGRFGIIKYIAFYLYHLGLMSRWIKWWIVNCELWTDITRPALNILHWQLDWSWRMQTLRAWYLLIFNFLFFFFCATRALKSFLFPFYYIVLAYVCNFILIRLLVFFLFFPHFNQGMWLHR